MKILQFCFDDYDAQLSWQVLFIIATTTINCNCFFLNGIFDWHKLVRICLIVKTNVVSAFKDSQIPFLIVNGVWLETSFWNSPTPFVPRLLTHFMPMVSFYTPWKHQKTSGNKMLMPLWTSQKRHTYLGPCVTFLMELLAKIVLYFGRSSIINVWQGPNYASKDVTNNFWKPPWHIWYIAN